MWGGGGWQSVNNWFMVKFVVKYVVAIEKLSDWNKNLLVW